jgi:hypothetical protein
MRAARTSISPRGKDIFIIDPRIRRKRGTMRKFWTILSEALIIVFLAGSGGQRPKIQTASAPPSSVTGPAALKIDRDFGKIPLYFIPNEGQVDARVAYYLQGKDKTIYFTSEGLTYVLNGKGVGDKKDAGADSGRKRLPMDRERNETESPSRYTVKLDFVGADADVRLSGEEKTGAVISYFKGKANEWKAGLPTYSRIVYKNLWPGIDLAYYGTVDKMKYEFVVHPGSDPSLIRLAYRGASAVDVNGEGRLEVRTPAGKFEDDEPVGYQEIDGSRVNVALKYLLTDIVSTCDLKDGRIVTLKNGSYRKDRDLVIDPGLKYSTFLGGTGADEGLRIVADGSGNAYITGYTMSSDFPVTAGAYDTQKSLYEDIFVAKLNAAGSSLAFATFIGGSYSDQGCGIALDGTGNIYITGWTNSTDFPVTPGAFDTTFNPGSSDWNHDAFVSKLNPMGSSLIYSTYLGGNYNDSAYGGIVVDGSGCAYVSGYTSSGNFPTTPGAFQRYRKGHGDAFITKFNSAGTGLIFSTLLGGNTGGNGDDGAGGIAVDNAGAVYVTGDAGTTDFPTTAGAYDTIYNGGTRDVFISKINASGTGLVYSTYLGSLGEESVWGIAIDRGGHAYVVGEAFTSGFPTTAGVFDTTYNGGVSDVFVSKINAAGSALNYSTYLGGSQQDCGWAIAVDAGGNACVTGQTASPNFPVTPDAYDATYNNNLDAFVFRLNFNGTALLYSTYLGGYNDDCGWSIAMDAAGGSYLTGKTYSDNFPATTGAYDTDLGYVDAFVAKISSIQKDDFLGTWDGQGVYYRNSDTGAWVKMASPATLITAGDLGGDGVDDLIGIWPTQGGVWVKSSTNGAWTKLSTTATHIAAGDMNGDGRVDFLGAWDGQGVCYRNSMNGAWVKMASPATLITAGDLDGDGIDDLIGIWPAQGGVWVKYSETGAWAKLSSTAKDIAAGDMNGDGRDDLLATWDGQGVYYRNSMNGLWVKMATPADQVTYGDLDADGQADLIGIWPTQGGVWVKYSATGSWAKLSSSARDIAAGKMRAGTDGSMPAQALFGPMGGYAQEPESLIQYQDTSSEGPGGLHFVYQTEELLIPQEHESGMMRIPGPGESGFRCAEEKNLFPLETKKRR